MLSAEEQFVGPVCISPIGWKNAVHARGVSCLQNPVARKLTQRAAHVLRRRGHAAHRRTGRKKKKFCRMCQRNGVIVPLDPQRDRAILRASGHNNSRSARRSKTTLSLGSLSRGSFPPAQLLRLGLVKRDMNLAAGSSL